MIKVCVTGASGFIGTNLVNLLKAKGYMVYPVPRRYLYNPKLLVDYIADATTVVHLAGANIGKRWTKDYKREIYLSRVETTKNLVESIRLKKTRVTSVVMASAVGIYKSEGVHTEESQYFADNFLANVVKDWEGAIENLKDLGIRTVILRQGVVLGRDGGLMKRMAFIFRMPFIPIFAEDKAFPWIHIDDLLNIYVSSINDRSFKGIYNAVSPSLDTFGDFIEKLSSLKSFSLKVRVPDRLVKFILGESACMIYDAPKVVPHRLVLSGFNFRYTELTKALSDLLGGIG